MRNKDRISLPYFRCNLLHFRSEGITKISKPRRKDRFGDWQPFWQIGHRSIPQYKNMGKVVFDLNEKAQKMVNLNAQRSAVKERDFLLKKNHEDAQRKEFISWVNDRFEYLLGVYRDDTPKFYPGGDGMGKPEDVSFHLWVPEYLSRKDMEEELSIYKEKKESLGVKDLPF